MSDGRTAAGGTAAGGTGGGAATFEAGEAAEDFAPGLERAFSAVPEERSYQVREASGRLPDCLRGTCYWNGPARFERGGLRYRHWLDGDGMVAALRFDDDGSVRFTNRFVRSVKWMAEEEAGRPLFRTFGTAFAGDRLARGIALESPANVSVIPFGRAAGGEGGATLLACGEQGLPWELDATSLETRGPFTFGGGINAVSPFAAHAKIDLASGELYNFGLSYARRQPCLHLYRFDAGGGLLARRRVPLALPVSMHDFCLAPRHLVFHVSPYRLDLEAVVAQGRSLFEALRWEPERGSELLIVARKDLEGWTGTEMEQGREAAVVRVPVGQGYCLHGIGAGEDAEGRLVVDWLELERPVYDQYLEMPELFTSVGPGRPVRLIVDVERGRLVERLALDYQLAPDFPVTVPRRDGRPPDDFWALGISAAGRRGRKFFDQLVHGDWSRGGGAAPEVWQAPPGQYLTGEPALAPEPSNPADPPSLRRGALVCPMFDGRRGESGYLVFDAWRIAAGPCAELRLEAPVPPAFHAAFVPAAR